MQVLRCADVEVEQAGQRQDDRADLVQVDLVVDAAQGLQVLLADGQGCCGAQVRPLGPVEGQVTVGIGGVDHNRNARCWASAPPRRRGGDRTRPAGEDVNAVCGDEDGVLELRGAAAVLGDRCPVVVPHGVLPSTAQRDHRLDGECHAFADDHRVSRVVVVQNLDVGVEVLADAVADERADNAHLVLLRVHLDGTTDLVDHHAGLHGFDAVPHALLRHADELLVLVADVADAERGIRVTVHAVDVDGDVQVDDVTVLKNA